MNHGLVLVCDRIESRSGIDIHTNTLEYTSTTYFDALKESLCKISDSVSIYSSPKDFIDNIQMHSNDIVLSAIWSGTASRNRKSLVAAVCEAYGISYVGADAYVQSVCQDKALSKTLCADYAIEIPEGYLVEEKDRTDVLRLLHYPVIIKPNLEGSSIGISNDSIADSYEEAVEKLGRIIPVFAPVLVEEYVDGREISICLAGSQDNVRICEAVQLIVDGKDDFHHEVWGFESKKGGASKCGRKIITDDINPDILDEALKIFTDLGKVDYMRIDGRLHEGRFHLIELTPDCSLHPDCFMSTAFKSNGYSYRGMVEELIDIAVERDSSVSV